MKRPFMVWIGFISICCSKVAKEGKSCPRLLVLQRVAQNAKSCSKVAEHNLFMPTPYTSRELMFVNLLLIFIHEKQVVDILQKVIDSSQADRGHKDKPSSGTNT